MKIINIKRNYSTEPTKNATKVVENGGNNSLNENVIDTTHTAAAVVNSTSTWNGPIDYIQMLMEYAVETQHMPFWIAIVSFTVGIRVMIAPATIMAYKNLIKSLIYAPKIRYYTQNMRDTYKTGKKNLEKKNHFHKFTLFFLSPKKKKINLSIKIYLTKSRWRSKRTSNQRIQ